MQTPDIFQEPRHLGALAPTVVRIAGGIGVVALVASVGLAAAGAGWQRFFFSYLLGFSYVLTITLGALFFVILQHLTRAGWSVVVRRWAEAIAAAMPLVAVLAIPIVAFGLPHLYHWSHPEVVAADPLLAAKRPYLNPPFFVARLVFYFGLWTLLARFYFSRSLRQDESGDTALTVQMERRSALAMVAFALSATFAAFDLLMSLDAHWFSTIFGVYVFAGSVVAFFAVLSLAVFGTQRAGLLRRAITVEHYHDLGKLLFAFTVFWAYIAFSQYMLIWYANLPEETEWLFRRQSHGWGWVGLVLIFGHFLAPFLAMLSRAPKRRPRMVAIAAVWMLAMHFVDLYWVVIPEVSPGHAAPALLDFTTVVGLVGVMVAAVVYTMRARSLVPERDPRLVESIMFENA